MVALLGIIIAHSPKYSGLLLNKKHLKNTFGEIMALCFRPGARKLKKRELERSIVVGPLCGKLWDYQIAEETNVIQINLRSCKYRQIAMAYGTWRYSLKFPKEHLCHITSLPPLSLFFLIKYWAQDIISASIRRMKVFWDGNAWLPLHQNDGKKACDFLGNQDHRMDR